MSMPGCVVEILVLGRQEGRLDAVGHRLDRQIEPAFAGELAHQRAVGGMDARRHRRLVLGEHLVVGQVLGQVADIIPQRRPLPGAPASCRCRRNSRSAESCPLHCEIRRFPGNLQRQARDARTMPHQYTRTLDMPMWAKCGQALRPVSIPANYSPTVTCARATPSMRAAVVAAVSRRHRSCPLRKRRWRCAMLAATLPRHSGSAQLLLVLGIGQIAELDQHRRHVGRLAAP